MNNQQLILLFILTMTSIGVLYLLTSQFFNLYARIVKDRYNPEKSNYIAQYGIFAITTVILAFISPNIVESIINLIIDQINKRQGTAYETISLIPQTIEQTIALVIFIVAVVIIIFISFRKQQKQTIINRERFVKDDQELTRRLIEEIKPIPIPKEEAQLHLRIKNLLELRYGADFDYQIKNLEEATIIYGIKQDQWDIELQIYYCHEDFDLQLTSKEQEKTYKYLSETIIKELLKDSEGKNSKINYHYIIIDGNFEPTTLLRYHTFTEKQFREHIIDLHKSAKTYLHELIDTFENKKLRNSDKSLKDTFIHPEFSIGLNRETPDEQTLEGYFDNWIEEESATQMVLLGDYGMGKSSFLKYYAHSLAKRFRNGEKVRFPVFLSLTNENLLGKGIEKNLEAFASRIGLDYNRFVMAIKDGRIIFLLDGFDEMSYLGNRDTRQKQLNRIFNLSIAKNKFILSGRPSYLEDPVSMLNIMLPTMNSSLLPNFHTEKIELERLPIPIIRKFLLNFFTLKQTNKYIKWIEANTSFKDLCQRPVLLKMVADMLPNLYSKESKNINSYEVITEYIDYWIKRQEFRVDPDNPNLKIHSSFQCSHEEKIEFVTKFFKELFYMMFKEGDLSLSKEKFINLLSERVNNSIISIKDNKDDFEEFFNGILVEMISGYFVEVKENSIKPVHKVFYEYFLANKIIKNILKGQKVDDEIWSEEVEDFIIQKIQLNEKNELPSIFTFVLNNCTDKIYKFRLINHIKKGHKIRLNPEPIYKFCFMFSFFFFAIVSSILNLSDLNSFINSFVLVLISFVFVGLLLPRIIIAINNKSSKSFDNLWLIAINSREGGELIEYEYFNSENNQKLNRVRYFESYDIEKKFFRKIMNDKYIYYPIYIMNKIHDDFININNYNVIENILVDKSITRFYETMTEIDVLEILVSRSIRKKEFVTLKISDFLNLLSFDNCLFEGVLIKGPIGLCNFNHCHFININISPSDIIKGIGDFDLQKPTAFKQGQFECNYYVFYPYHLSFYHCTFDTYSFNKWANYFHKNNLKPRTDILGDEDFLQKMEEELQNLNLASKS